jgi:hypothetical protein
MTHGEEKARRDARMAEMIAATGFERGDSRPPVFGEQIMGVWAGESNPQRVGKYVETRRRTGRLNPGVWYRLTDGRGSFWEYEASQTLFVPTRPAPETGTSLTELCSCGTPDTALVDGHYVGVCQRCQKPV